MSTYNSDSLAGPLAALLSNLVANQARRASAPSPFDGHSRKAPAISLQAYIERIEKYSGVTRAVVVAALAYMDRLFLSNPSFTLTETNIHRLLWTSIVISSKFFEDKFFTNDFYAKVGGVTLPEMNKLEITLLDLLKFELFLTPEQYVLYDSALTTACARYHKTQQSPKKTTTSVSPLYCPTVPMAACQ